METKPKPDKPLRIIFMGTPDFAVAALDALATSGHEIVCVYTRAPKPKGRGQSVQLSPVHDYAQAHGLCVRHPASLKSAQAQADFANLNADLGVVAAYGLILPKAILDAPRYGCLNIHASLLPRWRGASPIQRAIAAGDPQSGITIMQMDEGLDTGPMIARKAIAIHPRTDARSLHDALAALGSAMIEEAVNRLAQEGGLESEPQDDALSSYAPLLRKAEGRIDWTRPAGEIDRLIRALTPWPGAWTTSPEGKVIKVLEAVPVAVPVDLSAPSPALPTDTALAAAPGTVLNRAGHVVCGGGSVLALLRVQPESAKPMEAGAAINGGRLAVGMRLGVVP